uniref:Uncharacterized protein n=1 Tax=Cacopsylla melanoneura TaxID=428564 RepID=A0A8D8UU43_9HEMI
MSLLPLLLSELDDISLPNIYDQHFGLPSHYHNAYTSLAPRAPYHNGDYFGLVTPRVLSTPLRSGYLRPSRHTQAQDSGVSFRPNGWYPTMLTVSLTRALAVLKEQT